MHVEIKCALGFGFLGGGFAGSDSGTNGCRSVGDACCSHFLTDGFDLQKEKGVK